MKKSYIKLGLFIFIFSLLFILNSLNFRIINQVYLNILLVFLLIVFYILFGFEKDRHRYTKDIILEITIMLIIFFILYYLLGIIIGFAKSENYYSIKLFIKFIFPLIGYIILKELLRYQMLNKASESKLLILLVIMFFVIMDNTIPFSAHKLNLNREFFLLMALTFIPLLTENIFCSYLSLNFGYKPSIIYLLVIKLYQYLLPILPNPNEYLYSLIFFLLSVILFYKVKRWLSKDRTQIVLETSYQKKKNDLIYLIPVIVLTFSIVYVVSGYFKYYAIAVASGSMQPNIYKGDIVIVNQKYNDLNKGDIIAYKHDGEIIVHRINNIIDIKDEFYIYTKGDANKECDKYKITKDMIVGVVKFKLPLLGYPTVLINEKW